EAESWLFADQEGFAHGLQVEKRKLPRAAYDVLDAKGALLQLLAKSKLRYIRDEAVSLADRTRQGPGYNLHLRNFVRVSWNAERARDNSPSLARAFKHLQKLGDGNA